MMLALETAERNLGNHVETMETTQSQHKPRKWKPWIPWKPWKNDGTEDAV